MKKLFVILLALLLCGCQPRIPPAADPAPAPSESTAPLPQISPAPNPEETAPVQPPEPVPDAQIPALWAADCDEYISLRAAPGGTVLAQIPADGEMTFLSWAGQYARVSYMEQEGYVLSSYIRPADADYFSRRLRHVRPAELYSYAQMLEDISALCAAYPGLAGSEVIGKSELGRDIPVLRLGDPESKFQVLIQGAIHGREHMTAWLLMALADYQLAAVLPDDVCWHIIPMTNPDGVATSQSGALSQLQQSIHAEDLARGLSSLDPGEYASQWKANALGTDINRNFPAGWEYITARTAPSTQQFRGTAPFSAAEARILRDYTLAYDFDATLSYHSSGSIIYYEYGSREPANSDSRSLAEHVSALTGYPLEGSGGVDGAGYKDWAIDTLGIPSLTVEIGCGDSPLAYRELHSIFARNLGLMPSLTQWLNENCSFQTSA